MGICHESLNNPLDYAGAAQIMYGSSGGITSSGNWFVHQGLPAIEGLAEDLDNFGWTMTAIPVVKRRVYLPIVVRNYEP